MKPAGDTGPNFSQNAAALLAGNFVQALALRNATKCDTPQTGAGIASKAGVRKQICLMPTGQESSGDGDPSTLTTTASNEPATPPPEPTTKPPPPPAATTVATGEVTEETLRLREEKAALETKLKEREIEVATVKDTHERYRQAVEAVPVKKGPVVTKPNKVIAFGCMRRRA